MKKYLIKGLLALIVGGFVASCADDKVEYIPIEQQKATAYAEAFKELIGGEVAPDHDWGFTKTSLVEEPSATRAMTRTVDENANLWEQNGYVIPADITSEEIAAVRAVFDQKGAASYTSLIDWDCYFVQQVYKGEAVHTAENGNSVTGSEHMDWLCSVTNKTLDYSTWPPTVVYGDYYDEHIPKFNNGHCTMDAYSETSGKHILDLALMTNSNTTKFGFKSSEDNGTVFYNFRMEVINGSYYVGFDFEAAGDNDANANERVARDYIYNDWIVKIVPGYGVIPGGGSSSSSTSTRTDRIERRRLVDQGRIFCEDLGTNTVTTSDIDFNDAVFDAKIWRLGQYDVTYVNGNYSSETDYLTEIYPNGLENGKFKYIAEIRLLAAGGTIPLKIGGDKGFEIHSKFGEGNGRNIGHTTIINTMGAPSQANFTTTVNTETCEAVTVEVDITSLVAGQTEIGLDIIPIEVQWTSGNKNTVGEISADYGKVPQKLCVPIGTPWIYERIPITSAYKSFDSYARTKSPLFWDGTKDESLLYPSNPVGMTAETGLTGNVNTNPYHDVVVTQGTTSTTTVTETVLWEGTAPLVSWSGETQRQMGTNTTFNNVEAGDYLHIEIQEDGWWQFKVDDDSWTEPAIALVKKSDGNDYGFAQKGYIEIPLSQDDLTLLRADSNNSSCAFIIHGEGCTIKKVSIVRRTTTTN